MGVKIGRFFLKSLSGAKFATKNLDKKAGIDTGGAVEQGRGENTCTKSGP